MELVKDLGDEKVYRIKKSDFSIEQMKDKSSLSYYMLEMEKRAKPVVKFVDDNRYCIWGTPLYNEAQTKGDFISYVFGKKIF